MSGEQTLRDLIEALQELAKKMPPETLVGIRKPMRWSDGDHEVDWDIDLNEGPVSRYDEVRVNGKPYTGPMVVLS